MRYAGQCHCGKLKAVFETQKTPQQLGIRTCLCSFCMRRNAIHISDPEGEVVIDAAADDVLRYRFALRTADFLICRHCGTYICAVIGEGDHIRSVVNIVGLRLEDFLNIEETPSEFGAETTEERIARRAGRWTPTRFIDQELGAAYFGPH